MVDSKTFAKNSESSGNVEDGWFEGNSQDTPLNRLQERNYFGEGEERGSSAIITIEMCGCLTFRVKVGIIGVQMLARS